MTDGLKMEGRWTLIHRDKNGRQKGPVQQGKNIVVTLGMNYAAQRVAAGTPATHPKYLQSGSSAQTPSLGDTGLVGALGSRTTGSVTNSGNEVTATATLPGPGGGTWTVNEIGVFFDVAAGSSLFARFLIQTLVMAVGETLEVSWTVRMGV